MASRIDAYGRLYAAHPLKPARIGSVIMEERPAWRADTPGSIGAINGSAFVTADLAAKVRARVGLAASVGQVMLEKGDSWFGVGTAFLTSPTRMVTAGHVMAAFLEEQLRSAFPPDPKPALRGGIRFDGETDVVEISAWVLCHALWDLAVLEIPAGHGRTPLTAAQAQPAVGTPLSVIGYPQPASPPSGVGDVFPTFGRCYISPGRLREVDPLTDLPKLTEAAVPFASVVAVRKRLLMAHDVSTLPGYSGGPVIDLETGNVVGVHFSGSEIGGRIAADATTSDWNDALSLPGVLREEWLREQVEGQPPSGATQIYPVKVPRWGKAYGALESFAREADDGPPYLTAVSRDRPDCRDRTFSPRLSAPRSEIVPTQLRVYDQGGEATCAAFAVAMAIDRQLAPMPALPASAVPIRALRPLPAARRLAYAPRPLAPRVSVRMLDRMARNHDEWVDDGMGTSLRGVIKGFHHNGVCLEGDAPYEPGATGFLLTREMATRARDVTLGSYARVRKSIPDLQAAVQEAEAVVVSAWVHDGWEKPVDGVIDATPELDDRRRHAFAIVGYTPEGFIVQNSWGSGWSRYRGLEGTALWTYADWWRSHIDAWVMRIAPRAPGGFELPEEEKGHRLPHPRRLSLIGHVTHVERDEIVTRGALGLGLGALRETASYLSQPPGRDRYPILAFLFHDPFLDADTIERLVAAMTPTMKAAGVYPMHVAYGIDEMRTWRLRIAAEAADAEAAFARSGEDPGPYLVRRVGRVAERLVPFFEAGVRAACRYWPLWEMIAALLLGSEPRRIVFVSTGFGLVAAEGCKRLLGSRDSLSKLPVAQLAIAAPFSPGRRVVAWDLGLAEAGTITGYSGDWSHLLRAALGRGSPAAVRSLPHPDLEQALSNREVLKAVIDFCRGV